MAFTVTALSGQVDNDPVVAHRVTGDPMATTADCDRESVGPPEGDGDRHVLGAGDPHDQGWVAVDHPVPDMTCLAVFIVRRADDPAL